MLRAFRAWRERRRARRMPRPHRDRSVPASTGGRLREFLSSLGGGRGTM